MEVIWESGERENFFSREKKFSLSPEPPLSFKKSDVWLLPLVAVWAKCRDF